MISWIGPVPRSLGEIDTHTTIAVVTVGMKGELPEPVKRFVRLNGPEPHPVQVEMADYARDNGFPIIGQEVGGLLTLFTGMVAAERVLELGSGFGYSASWFARGLPDDGRLVLTEYDADELEMAREFFDRLGFAHLATFEVGDALEIVDRYDGPFDIVLMDQEKHQYVAGFEAIRDKVPVGGIVVTDNVMHGPVEFEEVLAGVETGGEFDETTQGVIDYLEHVRGATGFETAVIPLGSGIAVSVKRA